MALEHEVNQETFESLGEGVQSHYEKQGDNYYLQAVGLVPKSKLDEFRNNNIELKRGAETYQSTLDDLTAKLEKAGNGIPEDKLNVLVDEGVSKRVKALNEEHQTALNEALSSKTQLETQLNAMLINDVVQREAIKSGVRDTAIDDVLSRAGRVFKVADGKAIPYNGDEVIYGKDAVTPLSVEDWLAGQAVTAPHLFKESTGSGASNKDKSGGAAKKQITRNEWDVMTPADRSIFAKSGGNVI